jgi:bifunctional non-homologous end joining protein LigD
MAMAAQVGYVKPMEALAVTKLPGGKNWSYELKIDGHRLQAVSRGGHISLLSRRQASYTVQFPAINPPTTNSWPRFILIFCQLRVRRPGS